MNLSDEQAAAAAEPGSPLIGGKPEKRWAVDVMTGRWCTPPELLVTHRLRCDACHGRAMPRTARRKGDGWEYLMECIGFGDPAPPGYEPCGASDWVEWPYPFRMCWGGPDEWWLHSWSWLAEVSRGPVRDWAWRQVERFNEACAGFPENSS